MTAQHPVDPNCVFCRILARELPGNIRYESERVFAFDDIHPKSPTHVLICPKGHYPTLMDTPSEVLGIVCTEVKQVAAHLGVDERGFRLIINNGPESGQIVYHLHVHLLAGKRQHGF